MVSNPDGNALLFPFLSRFLSNNFTFFVCYFKINIDTTQNYAAILF